MDALAMAVGALIFGVGVICGALLDYYVQGRYLQEDNKSLKDHIVKMRKQGFVPQFETEYEPEIDLTLNEY